MLKTASHIVAIFQSIFCPTYVFFLGIGEILMPTCFLSLTGFCHRYYCSTPILWILNFIVFPKEKQGFLKNRYSKLRLIFSSFFLPTCVHFAIKIDQNLSKIDFKFYRFFLLIFMCIFVCKSSPQHSYVRGL